MKLKDFVTHERRRLNLFRYPTHDIETYLGRGDICEYVIYGQPLITRPECESHEGRSQAGPKAEVHLYYFERVHVLIVEGHICQILYSGGGG